MDGLARLVVDGRAHWVVTWRDQTALVVGHSSGEPAAVSILREHLPDLKVRVVTVVDFMKLQPQTAHPHGLSDMDVDELYTTPKPGLFAFHAYPWSIHRLTYRRRNHYNIHVRGYTEEGTITTPFDMTVLNELDRFHLVMDVIERLPQIGDKGIYLKQQLKNKLIEHRHTSIKTARICQRFATGNGQRLLDRNTGDEHFFWPALTARQPGRIQYRSQ